MKYKLYIFFNMPNKIVNTENYQQSIILVLYIVAIKLFGLFRTLFIKNKCLVQNLISCNLFFFIRNLMFSTVYLAETFVVIIDI